MITDTQLLGLNTAQRMAEEDANAEVMRRLSRKDGPTPFYLNCPLDAIEDVARGGYRDAPTVILFLHTDHVIVVDDREWRLDSRLKLWRKARAYARQLVGQGLLVDSPIQGGVAFGRPEAVIQKGG